MASKWLKEATPVSLTKLTSKVWLSRMRVDFTILCWHRMPVSVQGVYDADYLLRTSVHCSNAVMC